MSRLVAALVGAEVKRIVGRGCGRAVGLCGISGCFSSPDPTLGNSGGQTRS